MKATSASGKTTLLSSREALAIATLLTASHAAAQTPATAQAPKDQPKKKKDGEAETLPDLVVEANRETPYNPQNVQSPRFTAPLLNTPQNITVVPKAVYTQQAATSLNDVLKNTPGITFQAGEGGNPTSGDNQFRMRGFDAANSIFIDGVRDGGQQDRDIFNIEQVEIARGPAGADVGRTTAAGYINLVTKTPQAERFVTGSTSYFFDETNADGNFRQTVDYNQPLNELPLPGSAFRFNGLFQEGGVTGRELAEKNRWSLAPSFATGLGTDTRVFFTLQYTEQNNLPDQGMPRAALDNPANTPVPPSHVSHDTSYASKHAFEDVSTYNGGVRVEHDFNEKLTLINQTRYTYSDRFLNVATPTGGYTPDPSDTSTGLVARNLTANDRTNRNFSNLTTLRSEFDTGFIAHTLSAGFEYTHEEVDTVAYTGGSIGSVNIHNPDHSLPFIIRPYESGARTASKLDTYSINIFDTAKLSEKFELTGGVRLETYDLNYRSRATSGVVTEVDTDDTLADWKVGLVYKPVTNGSVYTSYGHSEQNPGTNLNLSASDTGTGADNVSLDPLENENIEVGVKWNFFEDKLTTTLAVFQTKQKNVGVTDSLGNIVQTADQEVRGIELGATGQITENWIIFAGFGYADSEYSNPDGTANNNGAQMVGTPEYSANLWTTYRFPFGLTIGGGARYADSTERSLTPITNGSLSGTDAYIVVDGLIAYELTENITVRFNVNNIFEEEYLTSVNNNGNRFNYGAPRSYVISADWKF